MNVGMYLQLAIRFLDGTHSFHGSGDGGQAEWPPSPLRLFQALLDAAASGHRTELPTGLPDLFQFIGNVVPEIIAPVGYVCNSIRVAVPNNDLDVWAVAVAKGMQSGKQPSELKAMKAIQPVRAIATGSNHSGLVSYLYKLPETERWSVSHIASEFGKLARSITHLGWGIDMVAADADVITAAQAAALPGERWVVTQSGGVALRVPTAGTLDDLIRKHQAFLNRLSDAGFSPVPPLREFAVRHYRRTTDPEPRPCCVFTILKPDASGNRAFSTPRRTAHVAAWIRHAVAQVCESAGWDDFLPFVHGHNSNGSMPNTAANSSQRFQYLPLPTINSHLQRVESIRRVMVAAPVGFQDRIDFLRRRLLGHELKWENQVIGLLNLQPGKDWVRDQYLRPATTWSTVTPVILDGFNDHNPKKTDKLLRKALANARIVSPLEFDYQPFGFRAGVEPVREFCRPQKLKGSMVHVKLQFQHPIPGPITIGAGRHRGFGLFAAE